MFLVAYNFADGYGDPSCADCMLRFCSMIGLTTNSPRIASAVRGFFYYLLIIRLTHHSASGMIKKETELDYPYMSLSLLFKEDIDVKSFYY